MAILFHIMSDNVPALPSPFNSSSTPSIVIFLRPFTLPDHIQSSLLLHLFLSFTSLFFSSFYLLRASISPGSCLSVTRRPAEAFETFPQIKQVPNFKALPPLVNEIFSERQCVSPPDTQNAAAPRPVQHPRGGPQKLDAGGSWRGLGNSSWWRWR